MKDIEPHIRLHVLTLVASLLAALITGALLFRYFVIERPPIPATNSYHMVVLVNGQAYFGKLEYFGSQFPALTDVYYIQSQVNEETKQVNNTLVKRGREWHSPDRMILNPQQILFIETVAEKSQVRKLIQDLKEKEK